MLRLLSLAALVAVAVVAPGCAKKSEDAAGKPVRPAAALKVLNYGNGAEPQDLDPQVITGTPEYHLMCAFFEGLVAQAPDGVNVEPGVAERWEISADGLVYTFHLRADAKWSDGAPVTARDFVRSAQRMLTASLAADYAYMFFHVAGAEDYYNGRLKDFSATGFKALDDRTLQLTLAHRTPFLLAAMLHHAWYPVPVAVVEKFGGLTRKGTSWTRLENFVGNGPFVLREWKQHQILVAERSPTYWDRAHVKLDRINFFPFELAETEEKLFRTHALDVTYEIPLAKIAVYRREQPAALRLDPYCGTYFYRFNVARKPFDDVRVRRAFALAIDRESIVKNVTLADEQPAYAIVPPGVGGYESRHHLQGDIAEAQRLLAEAGYPGGRGFPPTDLLYNTLEKHRAIAEALQQMWRKNLGVEIGIYNQEWKVYLDAQKTTNFQIQRAGWIADYVDPHVFFDLWRTGGGNNNTNWGSPEYDRLLARALDTQTNAERYEIYQQMEKILIDELPVMPIYFYTYARLVDQVVKNFRTTYLDNYPWKYVDVDR
ncbi:MAG TPA: peptide ABC transporter substrate-binding protein [Opitutaceae bacterium]|nr:peptide ABC transporter substrate-binding protein [Opitutaceae bacterium]